MIKSTLKFNISEPILNATNLGLIEVTVYNSVFNVNRRNNQFLNENTILAIIPGAYEVIEIAKFKKEETNGNVIMEADKKTMTYRMQIKQGELSFDEKNSMALLLGFRKKVYEQDKYTPQKILILWVLVLLTLIVL